MPTLQTADGLTLAYEQTGSGPHLLLIAGLGYGAWFWHRLAPLLAAQFTVTTFDNRGAGGSDKPAGPYTVDQMAEDAAAIITSLNLQPVTVLGHSLGGFIAQTLLYQRPELIARLILASTTHGGRHVIPITAQALAVMSNRSGNPLEVIQRGLEIAAAPGFLQQQQTLIQDLIAYRLSNPVPPAAYTAQLMAGAGTAAWSDELVHGHAAANQIPTLILFGQYDQVVPVGNADLLQAKLPHAQTIILDKVGHIFPLEDAAAAAQTIINWSNSL